MTTKTIKQTAKAIGVADARDAGEGLANFPDFPPRDDMQNNKHIYTKSTITALMNYLGNPDRTCVGSEIPLGWTASVRRGVLVPDLMVARSCDVDRLDAQDGYELRSQPNPPEFVLEVASVHAALWDYTAKRAGYAAYGVGEYWRFDPTDGRRYDAGLAGDRLAGGEYEPIELERYGNGNKRGYSKALGLYVCWEGEKLRLYDPVSESYLLTHGEEASARRTAEALADYVDALEDYSDALRDATKAMVDAKASARRAEAARVADAEARAEAEAAARADAEAWAEAEAEARRRAHEVIRQLQRQLDQRGGDG